MTQKVPLLLIPGLLCDAALWRAPMAGLADIADCHVPNTTQHDRIDAIARAILSDAPPQFALAGLSMGGYVALEIMRQAPARVLKLCLVDTSARADTPEQAERRRLLLTISKQGQFKGVTPRLLPLLVHSDRLKDVELVDIITAMAERVGREAFHNQQTAILHRIDSRPSLSGIAVPTQVIAGLQDMLTPPDIARELAGLIPSARLDLLEHCGHLAPLEKPVETTALMRRWLVG